MTTDLIVYTVLVAFLFLLCREITCWYFKFTAMVDALEDIRDEPVDF